MIGILRSKWREMNERATLRQNEASIANSIAKFQLEQMNNLFVDEESSGRHQFDPFIYSTADALNEADHFTLQRNCIKLYNTDGYVHGWVELFVNYAVGSECRLKSLDDDPATQEAWDEYAERENFPVRSQEVARRLYRDGEFFRRWFVNPVNGDVQSRFLNPLYIKSNGEKNSSFGIITSQDDIEEVLGLLYDAKRNGIYAPIPIAEFQHGKRGDSDMKRGRPLITPVLPHIIELNKLLRARQFFHRIRASVIIEEKIKSASPALIAAMADRKKSSSNAGDNRENGIPIGGIFRHSDGVEREYKTPNLQAADADVDIRRQILKVATAFQIAEFMATGDASNANMASQLIAESPAVKTFLGEQVILGRFFEQEHARVIQAKIDAGVLSRTSFKEVTSQKNGVRVVETIEVPRNLGAHVEFPELIHRDPLSETNALVLQRTQGWISDRTAQIRLNLDPIVEKEQINDEINAKGQPMAADTPEDELTALSGGNGDDDMLSTENPMESYHKPKSKQSRMGYYAKKLYSRLQRKTSLARARGQ